MWCPTDANAGVSIKEETLPSSHEDSTASNAKCLGACDIFLTSDVQSEDQS